MVRPSLAVLALMTAVLSSATPVRAEIQHKWAICSQADAERVVAFEVLSGARLVGRWTYPVKLWRVGDLIRQAPPLPVTRWLRAPDRLERAR